MKASISIGSEIDITLSSEEVLALKNNLLACAARVREVEECLERKILLSVGNTSNLFVDMKSLPEGACFEDVLIYYIRISPYGYELLQQYNRVCDRTGGPSRVNVYVR
jgi:hypothetical protein